MGNKRSGQVRTSISTMKQAKFLIIRKGLTQKEVAAKLDINEKTIGAWVIEYGWIADEMILLYETRFANSLQDFLQFVSVEYPGDYKKIQLMFDNYISHF